MKHRFLILATFFFFLFPFSSLLSPASYAQVLTGLKICIDPGHGGYDSNDRPFDIDANGTIDFYESESNFQKALRVKAHLETRGATVVLTRYSNTVEPSLSARVTVANTENADWFHSIHSNAHNQVVNYTLVLVRDRRSFATPSYDSTAGFGIAEWPEAWSFSSILSPRIKSALRTTSALVSLDYSFNGSLGVLRGLMMPGELSEGSFHDVHAEAWRLLNNSYLEVEAYAITWSFQQYFGAPTDGVGIVAGIMTDFETSKPLNNGIVRLLPSNRLYTGDALNNGFFMFDSVSPGTHWVRFETPGYTPDSMQVTVAAAGVTFADRTFFGVAPATVTFSSPRQGDTAFAINASIGVMFSRPMDTTSARLAFSMTPHVGGAFIWTNANKTLIFRPTVSLSYGSNYTMRVETTAVTPLGVPLDAKGLGYPNAHVAEFRTAPAPTGVEPDPSLVPGTVVLRQNFPNPFNPTTTIVIDLPHRTTGTLVVFDAAGREVARLLDGELLPGQRFVAFDGSRLPSGTYWCELRTAERRSAIKLLLLK